MGQVIIDISEDSEITIKVEGVKGKSCLDVTRELEKDLGIKQSRTLTKEYYEKPTANEQQQKIRNNR